AFEGTLQDATERFVQRAGSQGSGLGLAIVNEIVRLHGGQLTLTKTPMTCISIHLPPAEPAKGI
ncbi:MAG: ATP-binding protein, partial [Pseudomonadota bacterium]